MCVWLCADAHTAYELYHLSPVGASVLIPVLSVYRILYLTVLFNNTQNKSHRVSGAQEVVSVTLDSFTLTARDVCCHHDLL